MKESRRIPGRYLVLIMVAFAVFCAWFAAWGISKMRRLPQPPRPKNPGPFG